MEKKEDILLPITEGTVLVGKGSRAETISVIGFPDTYSLQDNDDGNVSVELISLVDDDNKWLSLYTLDGNMFEALTEDTGDDHIYNVGLPGSRILSIRGTFNFPTKATSDVEVCELVPYERVEEDGASFARCHQNALSLTPEEEKELIYKNRPALFGGKDEWVRCHCLRAQSDNLSGAFIGKMLNSIFSKDPKDNILQQMLWEMDTFYPEDDEEQQEMKKELLERMTELESALSFFNN